MQTRILARINYPSKISAFLIDERVMYVPFIRAYKSGNEVKRTVQAEKRLVHKLLGYQE